MMKLLTLIGLLAGLTASIYAQGEIALANIDNTSTNPSATANGLFWLSTGGTPALINQDFNAAFYASTDSSSLTLLATFLLSNGTATGDNAGGPGKFADPAGKTYPFQSISSVFVQIQAWTGNFDSYAAALAGGAPAAQSAMFLNPVDVPPGPARTLTGMPAMVLAIPEPSTFALGGLCVLLLCRRRK